MCLFILCVCDDVVNERACLLVAQVAELNEVGNWRSSLKVRLMFKPQVCCLALKQIYILVARNILFHWSQFGSVEIILVLLGLCFCYFLLAYRRMNQNRVKGEERKDMMQK